MQFSDRVLVAQMNWNGMLEGAVYGLSLIHICGYSDWEFPLDTLKRGLAASIGRAEAIRYLKKRQMM